MNQEDLNTVLALASFLLALSLGPRQSSDSRFRMRLIYRPSAFQLVSEGEDQASLFTHLQRLVQMCVVLCA